MRSGARFAQATVVLCSIFAEVQADDEAKCRARSRERPRTVGESEAHIAQQMGHDLPTIRAVYVQPIARYSRGGMDRFPSNR